MEDAGAASPPALGTLKAPGRGGRVQAQPRERPHPVPSHRKTSLRHQPRAGLAGLNTATRKLKPAALRLGQEEGTKGTHTALLREKTPGSGPRWARWKDAAASRGRPWLPSGHGLAKAPLLDALRGGPRPADPARPSRRTLPRQGRRAPEPAGAAAKALPAPARNAPLTRRRRGEDGASPTPQPLTGPRGRGLRKPADKARTSASPPRPEVARSPAWETSGGALGALRIGSPLGGAIFRARELRSREGRGACGGRGIVTRLRGLRAGKRGLRNSGLDLAARPGRSPRPASQEARTQGK
nr:translation initiation factor IF-2-like [Macaca fascicularis]XP_045254780.1 translation initiation factor IF-2-like [Macaca fascicularis]